MVQQNAGQQWCRRVVWDWAADVLMSGFQCGASYDLTCVAVVVYWQVVFVLFGHLEFCDMSALPFAHVHIFGCTLAVTLSACSVRLFYRALRVASSVYTLSPDSIHGMFSCRLCVCLNLAWYILEIIRPVSLGTPVM